MKKILLVGKINIIMKDVYSYIDEGDKYKVQVCPENKDVIEHIMEITEPDMIFLDYEMPEMNGKDFQMDEVVKTVEKIIEII